MLGGLILGLLLGGAIGAGVMWFLRRDRPQEHVALPPHQATPATPFPARPVPAAPAPPAPEPEPEAEADPEVRQALDASSSVLAELEKRYVGRRAQGEEEGPPARRRPRARKPKA